MSLDTQGFAELAGQIERMANRLNTDEEGAPTAKRMLHSLSAQVSYYSQYIQQNPAWEYAGVYVDEALTGTKDSRPEFQRMLADCKAGKIDRILTKSLSRFARNTVTVLESVRMLKSLGIDPVSQAYKGHLGREAVLPISMAGADHPRPVWHHQGEWVPAVQYGLHRDRKKERQVRAGCRRGAIPALRRQ